MDSAELNDSNRCQSVPLNEEKLQQDKSIPEPLNPPAQCPAPEIGADTKKRKHGQLDIRESIFLKIRAIVKELRPHFIEVIHAPDMRDCKPAHEIKKQLQIMLDLTTQIKTPSSDSGKPVSLPESQHSHWEKSATESQQPQEQSKAQLDSLHPQETSKIQSGQQTQENIKIQLEPLLPQVKLKVQPESQLAQEKPKIQPEPQQQQEKHEVQPEPQQPPEKPKPETQLPKAQPEPQKPQTEPRIQPEPQQQQAKPKIQPDPQQPQVQLKVQLKPQQPQAEPKVQPEPQQSEGKNTIQSESQPEEKSKIPSDTLLQQERLKRLLQSWQSYDIGRKVLDSSGERESQPNAPQLEKKAPEHVRRAEKTIQDMFKEYGNLKSEEGVRGSYVVGGSPLGRNFIMYPGVGLSFYGESKQKFLARRASGRS